MLARREFVERGRTKVFLVAMTLLALSVLAIGPIANAFIDDELEPTTVGLSGREPPGIEEEMIAQGEVVGMEIVVERYTLGVEYEADLEDGTTAAVLINGDEIKFFDRPDRTLAALIERSVNVTVERAALQHLGLSEGEIEALQTPVEITVSAVEVDDDPRDGPQEQAERTASFLGAMALYVSIIMFAQFVAVGTVEEKQTRVVEVVLSKVRAWQLLVGKVVGIGVLGLVQLFILASAAFISLQFVNMIEFNIAAVGLPVLANVFFWYILGFTFYAFLYAALGSTVSRQEDLQGLLWLPVVLILPGYFLSIRALQYPDATLAQVTSMLPMWAPFVMPVRIGAGVVEPWELAVSVVGVVLGALALIWVGSRVYRGALLRTGSRVGLRDAWRSAGE